MRRILFTKYSNERDPRFAVRTDIWEENGERGVSKSPCYPQGRDHIEHIYQTFQELEQIFSGARLQINRCRLEQDGVSLEYLKGETLQEKLDGLLKRGRSGEFQEILEEYIRMIRETAREPFQETAGFREVFGEFPDPAGFFSAKTTDIDMVLGNVIVQGDQWTLIDYEWSFSFPIPIEFVIYRILHYYEKSNAFRNQVASWGLYEKAGIGKREQELFCRMEQSFQTYILGTYTPLRTLYPRISPGKVSLSRLLEGERPQERLQAFLSKDGICREEQSVSFPMKEGKGKAKLTVEEGTSFIRLDPGESVGCVRIQRLEWGSGKSCAVKTNGVLIGQGTWLFTREDPQLYIEEFPEGETLLLVELQKEFGLESYAREIEREREKNIRQEEEIKELANQLKEKEKRIRDMENTRVWKTYRKYKKMIKGE